MDVKVNREASETYKLYYVQAQHQILVADAPKGYLVFFCNDELLKFGNCSRRSHDPNDPHQGA